MKNQNIVQLSLSLSLVSSLLLACGYEQEVPARAPKQALSQEQTRVSKKQKVVELLKSIETGDSKPVSYINAKKYRQHNLAVGDGLEGFGELLSQLPEGSAKVDTVRVFGDGDFVFAHTNYNFFGPKVGFDIFRFENGQIVEHWDNLAEITAPNPSGRTQLDGETVVSDPTKTEENKKLVAEFVSTVLVKQQYGRAPDYIAEEYKQHNSNIGDNLSGLATALEALGKQGITMVYDKVHEVLGEGDFVLVVSEGKFGGTATSYYDLFRVEAGKIVEHWGVMESILPADQHKNGNGKFGFPN